MRRDLIIYGYNCKNLGDDLMFAEIINKTNYKRYFFIGHGEVPNFVNKEMFFIKPGRLMKLRWKLKADFAVIGGSVLMGASPQQKDAIRQKIEWFKWNKITGGRNFIIGANLGPYDDEKEYLNLLTALGSVVDKWFVRDNVSFDMLEKVKTRYLKLMPDIVMGFDKELYMENSDSSVAISVTSVAKDNNNLIDAESYAREIAQLAQSYIDQGKSVNLLSFEDRVDLTPIDKIASLIKQTKGSVNIIKNVGEDIVKAIAKADVIVSTRFHAMVLAALFEKKQIIYAYNNKTTQFAQTYGFKTYAVTGSYVGKDPVKTSFEKDVLRFANTYAELVQK